MHATIVNLFSVQLVKTSERNVYFYNMETFIFTVGAFFLNKSISKVYVDLIWTIIYSKVNLHIIIVFIVYLLNLSCRIIY